MDDLKTFAE